MIFQEKKRLIATLAVAVVIILIIIVTVRFYWYIFKPNVRLGNDKESTFLYIPTGGDFRNVEDSLKKHDYLRNYRSFKWLSEKRGYPEKVRPGRYRIKNGMNNMDLVRLLMSGKQEPVNVVFNSIRTKADLAGRIGRQLEADSAELLRMMNDPSYLQKFDVTPYSVFRLFVPNSYQFYWNTSADEFFGRMNREQKKFWTNERIDKSGLTGLSIDQIITLASIVEKETNKDSEKPIIAGVYLNRLQKNMALQADPTLVFALNDFTIKRLTGEHLKVKSPYNTYINTGLPPGPICLPSIASIDAVLNYKKHNYLYFCARDDLSGYHVFAFTYDEHSKNALKYRRALNKLNIR